MSDLDKAYFCGGTIGAWSVLQFPILAGILFSPWPGWFVLFFMILLWVPYTAARKFQKLKGEL